MKYVDLQFTAYDALDRSPVIVKKSVFDVWPSFPLKLLEGNSEQEILSKSIDAIIEGMGENCLLSEFADGEIVIHCGDLDAEIQEKYYDFVLVKELPAE